MITGNETVYPVVEMEDSVAVASQDERGITIRQHFAAMAMQGLLSDYTYVDGASVKAVAKDSVAYADALITELNESKP